MNGLWPCPLDFADCVRIKHELEGATRAAAQEVGGFIEGDVLVCATAVVQKAQRLALDRFRVPYEWVPHDEYIRRIRDFLPTLPASGDPAVGCAFNRAWWDA